MKCESCKIWVPIVVIILLSLFITYQFVEPAPPRTIRMATGREGGGYHAFALEYQKRLAKEQFQLDIQPTAGSVEVLEKLKSGEVLIGLVQGGTGKNDASEESEELESLASLFYEPLWVFHRKDHPLEYLFDLRGKRIAIGEEGSGTRSLALQLLQDNHVTLDNTTFLAFPSEAAAQSLIAGEIDAAFFVMSPTASIIFELLNHPEIELLSFKRNIAYSRRYPFLTSVEIGEGMIDLEQNIPQQDKILLAATASLVAHKDLHPNLVHLLLKTMNQVHKKGGFLERPGQFPSEQFVEFPMKQEAIHYLQNGPTWLENIFPFWIACRLDQLKILLIPLLAVILPLFKGVLPLYRWGIRFKIFRWYGALREVDRKVDDLTDLAVLDAEVKQLKTLKKEIIEQVSVPLSYMGEFYSLRMHIKLILTRLEERRQEILAGKHSQLNTLR